MKRLIRFAFLIFIAAISGSVASFADSGAIGIKLDGADIINDSPPVIIDGRTLVPARAVFEAMGGAVEWIEASREVTVTVGETRVRLKIDSMLAYINDSEAILDVPAHIINGRTMIPVRFVSEAVGCEVSWDNTNRIVSIVTPAPEEEILPGEDISPGEEDSAEEENTPEEENIPEKENRWALIDSIELSRDGNRAIIVNADKEIKDYTITKMKSLNRLIFDIKGAKLDMKSGVINGGNNPFIKSVRYSQFTNTTVRITADLKGASSGPGTVNRSDSMRTVYLAVQEDSSYYPEKDNTTKPAVTAPAFTSEPLTNGDLALLGQYGLSPVAEEARHKLVVIDPGHGGTDPGAIGYENKKIALQEKDVNLDIALRAQKLLEAAGARLYMIRTQDVTIPLYDRQDTANGLKASLYVAIHNNSYTSSRPSGTEVHYHGDDPPLDGISAREVAENLQRTLVSNLGLPNRGAQVSPELAVTRRTVMPAVIIEGAYISNPNDRAYMKTDGFREKYALSVAKCVIEALNKSVSSK